MIQDYGLFFTPKDGQLFDAATGVAEYGSKLVYLGDSLSQGAQDPAVETDITAQFKVVDADVNNVTNLKIEVVADDDGAGTNEVVLVTRTVLLASLTKALGVRTIGKLPRLAAPKKVMRAKVTTTGTAATAGKISVWLQVGPDSVPANAAGNMA